MCCYSVKLYSLMLIFLMFYPLFFKLVHCTVYINMFLSLHMCIMMAPLQQLTCEDSVLQSCETVLPLSNSNHFGILSAINTKNKKTSARAVEYGAIYLQIGTVPVRHQLGLLCLNNIEESWSNSLKCFMSIMKQFMPQDITCSGSLYAS